MTTRILLYDAVASGSKADTLAECLAIGRKWTSGSAAMLPRGTCPLSTVRFKRAKMAIWKKSAEEITSIVDPAHGGTLVDHLGIEIMDVGDDWLKARMPVDRRTVQPQGRLHGGASVALAETVGSIAANMALEGNELLAVGLDINANHVRPISAGYVYGVATPESLGRSTQVWTIRVSDDDDRLVCIARLTMAVIPMRRP